MVSLEVIPRLLNENLKPDLNREASFQVACGGMKAHLSLPKRKRIPLNIREIQDSLMVFSSSVGTFKTLRPKSKAFSIKNSTYTKDQTCFVLVVENISVDDVEKNRKLLGQTLKWFNRGIEITNPILEGSSLSKELATYNRAYENEKQMFKAFPQLKNFLSSGRQAVVQSIHKSNFDTVNKQTYLGCRKTQLLLRPSKILHLGLPTPAHAEKCGYVFTKDEYKPVTDTSPLFGIDCEFCVIKENGQTVPSRVAIVDENLEPIYHSFVKYDKPLKKTHKEKWKGLAEVLEKVQKNLTEIQNDIRNLLPPDAILVGHHIHSDLHGLQLIHPYIIDTSSIFNLTGQSVELSLQLCSTLFSNRDIQGNSGGHDPTEDAIASLDLVLQKLKRGLGFGDTRFYDRGMYQPPDEQKLLKFFSVEKLRNDLGNQKRKLKNSGQEDASENLIPKAVRLDVPITLHLNFVDFLGFNNRKCCLIVHPDFEMDYRPKSRQQSTGPASDVEIHLKATFTEAMTTATNHVTKQFTMVHTVLEENEDKRHLKLLEKAIVDIYHSIPEDTLMILLFGGKEGQNGCCLGTVKQKGK